MKFGILGEAKIAREHVVPAILAAGHGRIMVHQPSAGFQGQATDIEIHANEVLALKKRLNEIYSKHTGKSVDEVKKALERDNFMTSDTAKEIGLSDKMLCIKICFQLLHQSNQTLLRYLES